MCMRALLVLWCFCVIPSPLPSFAWFCNFRLPFPSPSNHSVPSGRNICLADAFFVYCPECYSGILRKLRIIQNILPIHNRSCARRWFAVYPPPLRLTPYTLHPLGQLLPNDSGTFSKKVLFLRFSSFVPPLYLPYKRPTMNQGRTKEHRKNSQSSKSAFC